MTAERFHYGGGIRAQRRRLLIQVDGSGYAVAMRKGIEIDVSATDCARLEAIVADRNSPQGIPPVGAAVRRLVLNGVL